MGPRTVAREFYRKLLPEFGMKPVFDGDRLFYCVGARTAIGFETCDPALAGERFVQQRVGLHHLCLRARSREGRGPMRCSSQGDGRDLVVMDAANKEYRIKHALGTAAGDGSGRARLIKRGFAAWIGKPPRWACVLGLALC
jgi:hypothetical protein